MRAISSRSVAAMLGVSKRTVERMVSDGRFPGPSFYLPAGEKEKRGDPRWYEFVALAWMAQREAVKADEPPPAVVSAKGK